MRTEVLAELDQLTPTTKMAQVKVLLSELEGLPAWKNAKTIGVTYSVPVELPTLPIIMAAWAEGKRVTLPKVMPHRQLAFFEYDVQTPLIQNDFGLSEPVESSAVVPEDIDLLIVPGLRFAADTQLRLGFGGGYYDRFLAKFAGVTLSMALPEMVVPTADWPIEKFDQAVDILLKK
ncbi:5-formyltetrahydrofolate cyclo-ligase [Periweissella cryptocerci]|uniref:5-formyltetrahydrofolate cyclo-ligase n=2 Tax=Periweissella cryptocerci TaxID=2506420 RepID=A0A4P6YXB0_9LACO|nr:5-formyltetrahydrofolate cyclo-ligase [Periweissella cryptocerci]